ncbi:MAG: HPr family phosphocarrier protein [Anaerolineales bacterium]|nr:HPr family phosphocarrier protein [Anaerolineales bacterium]
MVETTITIKHEVGLHARPAAVFAKTAQSFEANITVKNVTRDTQPVNAKSVINLFKIAVSQGHSIHLTANGSDEDDALAALVGLIEDNFGETQ